MKRTLLCAGAAVLSFAGLAHAQPAVQNAPPPAEPPSSAAPTAGAARNIRPGLPVKDVKGAPLGKVSRVGATPDGAAAVEIQVEGKPIVLAMSSMILSPAGDEAFANISKGAAKAAAEKGAASEAPPAQ